MSLIEYQKKKKIVLISGLSTSGKTTVSHELTKVLPGWVFVDIWKIKEIFHPLGLKDRTDLINISKKSVITITREVIKKMRRNIILQEAKTDFIKKYLGKEINKYNYEIYSFYLKVDVKDAIKRDLKRRKPTMNIAKHLSDKAWKDLVQRKIKRNDFVIDTSKNNVKEVVNIILREINEKSKKHPKAHALRKSW